MARLVVDASVAVKWYVPEPGSDRAASILDGGHRLIAPDLIIPEFGNIIWKKVNRGEFFGTVGAEIIDAFVTSEVIDLQAAGIYLPAAFELATTLQRTVYDSLYLAIALAEDCRFVTADERLVNAVQNPAVKEHIVMLGSFV